MIKFKPILHTAAVVGVILALASVTQAGSINGSAHDFGLAAWSVDTSHTHDSPLQSGGSMCQPCHIPHGFLVKDAAGNYVDGPLWAHKLSANGTTGYLLYAGMGQPGAPGTIDQNTELCLSCHDGTVALDSYGGGSPSNTLTGGGTSITWGSTFMGTAASWAVFGQGANDLSNDHPLGSAAYWPAVNPSWLVNPTFRGRMMPLRTMVVPATDGSTVAVGCTSCHEPHNGGSGEKLLWVSNYGGGTTVDGRAVNGSILCQNCHIK